MDAQLRAGRERCPSRHFGDSISANRAPVQHPVRICVPAFLRDFSGEQPSATVSADDVTDIRQPFPPIRCHFCSRQIRGRSKPSPGPRYAAAENLMRFMKSAASFCTDGVPLLIDQLKMLSLTLATTYHDKYYPTYSNDVGKKINTPRKKIWATPLSYKDSRRDVIYDRNCNRQDKK